MHRNDADPTTRWHEPACHCFRASVAMPSKRSRNATYDDRSTYCGTWSRSIIADFDSAVVSPKQNSGVRLVGACPYEGDIQMCGWFGGV